MQFILMDLDSKTPLSFHETIISPYILDAEINIL